MLQSPLFPTHTALPPQSATPPQPSLLHCLSSHTCLSNHSAAGLACKSISPSHQHATSVSVGTISGSFSVLPYLASDNATVDSASTVSLIYADSPLLAADSPLASFRVLHSPSSEPLAFFDADRYVV
jgi:hypothetical protein